MDVILRIATAAGVAAVLVGFVASVIPEPRFTNYLFWLFSVAAILVSSLVFLIPENIKSAETVKSMAGSWVAFGIDHSSEEALPDGNLEVRQKGKRLEAVMTLTRTRSGHMIEREYIYSGEIENLQVIFRFNQRKEEGVIVGAVVLSYEPQIRAMVGKSVYYDFKEKRVIAENCAFYRDISTRIRRTGNA